MGEQCFDKGFWIEWFDVVECFADADKLHRDIRRLFDGYDDAAPRFGFVIGISGAFGGSGSAGAAGI